MRYYNSEIPTQIFIISLIYGWILRKLGQAGKEIWKIMMECMEITGLQKIKNPALRLAPKRDSKTPIYRG